MPPNARGFNTYGADGTSAEYISYCFGPAGAGAAAWEDVGASLDPGSQIRAIRLPGREARFTDPPLRTVTDQVADTVDSILPLLAATDTPYSLVGACSGAITAYETARAIYQLDVPPPASLIVISQPNPSRTSSQNPEGYIPMTTGKARELLRVNGNLADEFLTSEVVELFYDTLDADYAAYSGYRYVPAAKLACNIVAVRGTLDSQFSAETAAEWSEFTSSSFELRHVAGRSRLIDDAPDGIAELIGSLRTSCR